jgi:hypothetical protein
MIAEIVSKGVSTVEVELKNRSTAYNTVKQTLTQLQKKQS